MVTGIQITTRVIDQVFFIIRNILRYLRVSFVPIVRILSLIFLAVLILTAVASFVGLTIASPVMNMFGPESYTVSLLGYFALFFLIGIPVLSLIAFIMRIAFKTRVQKEVSFVAWSLWFVALFFIFYSGTMTAIDFKHLGKATYKAEYPWTGEEIVVREWNENLHVQNFSPYMTFPVYYFKDSMIYQNVHVKIKESDSPFLTIEKSMEARGLTESKAMERAHSIQAPYKILGNEIFISSFVRVPKNSKWRNHEVHYTIYVPVGKKIRNDYKPKMDFSINMGYLK